MNAPASRAWRAAPALIASAFVVLCWQLLDRCLDDDAYISFRYARNLIEGHGLVYNAGERVEGYTNFLWTVLCAGLMKAGVPIHAGAQLTGIVFGTSALLVMHRVARQGGTGAALSLAAPAALTFTLPFAVETLLGLEIPLYVCLSLIALALWAPVIETQSKLRGALCGAVFALSAMTRPEGMALFALCFVPDALESKPAQWPWRAWLQRALGFAVVFAPYFAWRFSYYGYPLPNTFYAKTGGGAWLWSLGAEYVGSGMLRAAPVVLLVAYAFARAPLRIELPRHARLSALWAVFIAAYLVSVGGDFRQHYRFFVPILAWLFLAAGACAQVLHQSAAPKAKSALVLASALAFAWPISAFYPPAMEWVHYREHRNPQLFAVGAFMKAYAKPGELMAISGGGIIPYVSALPAIEMWGLTDLHIARTPSRRIARGVPGHTKGDGAYILKRNPRYVVFIALMSTSRPPLPEEIGARVAGPSELDLWQSAEFHQRYRLASFPLPDGQFTNIFERVD